MQLSQFRTNEWRDLAPQKRLHRHRDAQVLQAVIERVPLLLIRNAHRAIAETEKQSLVRAVGERLPNQWRLSEPKKVNRRSAHATRRIRL